MLRSTFFSLVLILMLPSTVWAEDAALVDLQGADDSFAGFVGQGKWTVAMIWASYCGICNREAPEIEAFHYRYKDRQVQVVGLSIDGKNDLVDANAFALEHGLTFPNLVGEADDIALMYFDRTGTHMIGTPSFLVYDPQGELRTFQAGALEISALERMVSEPTDIAANNLESTK